MGFVKFGAGEVLPEPEDKVAAQKQPWTQQDRQELVEESGHTDGDEV